MHSDHCVENGEQLSHAGDERQLLRFAGFEEPEIFPRASRPSAVPRQRNATVPVRSNSASCHGQVQTTRVGDDVSRAKADLAVEQGEGILYRMLAIVGKRAIRAVFVRRTASRIVHLAIDVASIPGFGAAQRAYPPNGAALTGTYASGTSRLASSGGDGCWLEAAPARADSMHLQVLCRKPAPGHHVGVLDARLRLRATRLVYDTDNEFGGHCRITVRFAGARAIVTQEGSDQACGFGAFVDVSGTYMRIDKRRPPFDLAPLERSSSSPRALPASY